MLGEERPPMTPPARPGEQQLRRSRARLLGPQIAAVGGQQVPARSRQLLLRARYRRPRRSRSTTGLTKASAIVVLARSYSRQTGDTSWESEIVASGLTARTYSAIRFSWSGNRYEKRQQTATTGGSSPACSSHSRIGSRVGLVQRLDLATVLVDAAHDSNAVTPSGRAAWVSPSSGRRGAPCRAWR